MADERSRNVPPADEGWRESEPAEQGTPHSGTARGPRVSEDRMKNLDELGEEDTELRRETDTSYAMGETGQAGDGPKVTPEGDVFARKRPGEKGDKSS